MRRARRRPSKQAPASWVTGPNEQQRRCDTVHTTPAPGLAIDIVTVPVRYFLNGDRDDLDAVDAVDDEPVVLPPGLRAADRFAAGFAELTARLPFASAALRDPPVFAGGSPVSFPAPVDALAPG
jgi:hypothetical protein